MIVYFNNLGQVKEIINNESIREGNFNVNSIYFYLEETANLSLFEVVWKDRELTTIEKAPKKYNVEIPYNPKADYKYFKEYNTYECYKVDIPTNGVLDSEGLKTASIRIKVQGSDTINTLGIITFLVEQSNVLPTQSISVSQYDYLLTVIGQETKQTVIGVGDEELIDGKDVSGRFDNDNFLVSRHGGILTIAYVSQLTEKILFDANLLNNVITLANSTQTSLESTQALVNTINTELENLKNTSATKEELGNYYTKNEINELFITKRFHYEIVDTLPTVGESNVLYLVLKEKTQSGNVYTKYIWLEKDKRYEEIGDTGADLTGYVQGNGLDKDYLIIGNGDSKIIKSNKTLTSLLNELNSKVNQTTYENLVKVVPTDIDYNDGFTLMHDTTEIAGQTSKVKLGTNLTYDPDTRTINASGGSSDTAIITLTAEQVQSLSQFEITFTQEQATLLEKATSFKFYYAGNEIAHGQCGKIIQGSTTAYGLSMIIGNNIFSGLGSGSSGLGRILDYKEKIILASAFPYGAVSNVRTDIRGNVLYIDRYANNNVFLDSTSTPKTTSIYFDKINGKSIIHEDSTINNYTIPTITFED